jgi:HSP20 family protein
VARIFLDLRDVRDDLQRQFGRLELAPAEGAAHRPQMDVLETDAGIEILIDLPGIDAAAVSIVSQDGTVVISGTKGPTRCGHGHVAFHLAERGFGRFRRSVRIGTAFDAGRAEATLAAGELRIVLPRIDERRGRPMPIRIDVP